MGCKLQEAAAKYQYEGFSRIYIACAGTDMQKLIILLETMFGEMDIEDIDLSKMETETTRDLRKEAEAAEAASTAAETRAISRDKIMRVYVTSLPVPLNSKFRCRTSQKQKVLRRGLLKTLPRR